jgi:hypothetical protein
VSPFSSSDWEVAIITTMTISAAATVRTHESRYGLWVEAIRRLKSAAARPG